MINLHLGDHVTESQKSPLFWKLQVSFWVSYTLLQGVVGFALITNGILSHGSEGLLLELILLKSACGFLITSSLRPLLIRIHSKRWHPSIMLVLICISSILLATLEHQLMILVPFFLHSLDSLRNIRLLDTSFTNVGFLWEAIVLIKMAFLKFLKL
jgi:hypothetical protein